MTVSVLFAGLPNHVNHRFVDRFPSNGACLIGSVAMKPGTERYTPEYADRVFERAAEVLKKRRDSDWREAPSIKLVVLYLDAFDDGAGCLFERLGIEAMILPVRVPGAWEAKTGNQVNRAVRGLLRESERALAAARDLMGVVNQEINSRRNKTCLLLPEGNFGRRFRDVTECVREASATRLAADDFRRRLREVAERLPKDSKRNFIGQRSLVFNPAKALHGQPPIWGTDGRLPGCHLAACAIRGRVRFGVAFDPRHHYDCPLPRRQPNARRFRSCHGTHTLDKQRQHANIAPNDNVR